MTAHALVGLACFLAAACDESASPIRSPAGSVSCATVLEDPLTLAQFDFETLDTEADVVADTAERNSGAFLGTPTLIDGPAGCGQALSFEDNTGYVEVPHSADWELDEGAVDFWFFARACADGEEGVMTRDAEFTARNGHFRVIWRGDCRLAARTQLGGPEGGDLVDGAQTEVATSNPLPLGQWSHFAVNFGRPGLELWLNGERVGFAPTTSGIRGNENPWTIGVSNDRSEEGTGLPVWKPLRSAALDHVRILGARRAFSRRR